MRITKVVLLDQKYRSVFEDTGSKGNARVRLRERKGTVSRNTNALNPTTKT